MILMTGCHCPRFHGLYGLLPGLVVVTHSRKRLLIVWPKISKERVVIWTKTCCRLPEQIIIGMGVVCHGFNLVYMWPCTPLHVSCNFMICRPNESYAGIFALAPKMILMIWMLVPKRDRPSV